MVTVHYSKYKHVGNMLIVHCIVYSKLLLLIVCKPHSALLVTSHCTLMRRFCMSRKGGTGGGGWDHPQGAVHMGGAISTVALRIAA